MVVKILSTKRLLGLADEQQVMALEAPLPAVTHRPRELTEPNQNMTFSTESLSARQ